MGNEQVMTSETHPIYADFVPEEHTKVPGRLGMTFAPGMKARWMPGRWDRDLKTDLRVLREEHGAGVLVSVSLTSRVGVLMVYKGPKANPKSPRLSEFCLQIFTIQKWSRGDSNP